MNGGKRVSPSDRHRASRVDRLTDGSLPAAVDFLLEERIKEVGAVHPRKLPRAEPPNDDDEEEEEDAYQRPVTEVTKEPFALGK